MASVSSAGKGLRMARYYGLGGRGAVVAVLLALLWAGPAAAESLRERLYALSLAEGFTVSHAERLAETEAPMVAPLSASIPVSQRIRAMLQGYNYVLLYDSMGRIKELQILGPAPSAAAVLAQASVSTTRRGVHHVVEAELVGPNGAPQKVPLMLDTGATMVVLPLSMTETLGFENKDLTDGWAKTAAGRVPVKSGWLRTIKVGRVAEKQVAVSFIEDSKLGEQTLLGMSFLERFRFTIDDQNDRIILMPR